MALQSADYFLVERSGAQYHARATDILAYVQANIGSSQYEAADINARNAMTGLSFGDLVFVTDASADATVTSGWALYQYIGSGWRKLAEEESMDVTFDTHDPVTLAGNASTNPLTLSDQVAGFSISQLTELP